MITLRPSIALTAFCLTLIMILPSCQKTTVAEPSIELTQAALLSVACTSCHSKPGMGVPKLTNLSEERIAKYLTYYKSDEKGTSVMHRLSRGLTPEDIQLIAQYYGQEK